MADDTWATAHIERFKGRYAELQYRVDELRRRGHVARYEMRWSERTVPGTARKVRTRRLETRKAGSRGPWDLVEEDDRG